MTGDQSGHPLPPPTPRGPLKARLSSEFLGSLKAEQLISTAGESEREVSGLLFGHWHGGLVDVQNFQPFEAGAAGTAEPDGLDRRFERSVAAARAQPGLANLDMVGWFSVRARESVKTLLQSEIEFHNRFFTRADDVVVVLRPDVSGQLRVELFAKPLYALLSSRNYRSGFVLVRADGPFLKAIEISLGMKVDESIYLRTYNVVNTLEQGKKKKGWWVLGSKRSSKHELPSRISLKANLDGGSVAKPAPPPQSGPVTTNPATAEAAKRNPAEQEPAKRESITPELLKADAPKPEAEPRESRAASKPTISTAQPFTSAAERLTALAQPPSPGTIPSLPVAPIASAPIASASIAPASIASQEAAPQPVEMMQSPAADQIPASNGSGKGLPQREAKSPDGLQTAEPNERHPAPPAAQLPTLVTAPEKPEAPRTSELVLAPGRAGLSRAAQASSPKETSWLPLMAVFVLTAGLTFGIIHFGLPFLSAAVRPTRLPQAAAATVDLGMRVESQGQLVMVSWHPALANLQASRGGTLTIYDGARQREIHLDAGQVADGSVLYKPTSPNVVFHLEFRDTEGLPLEDSVRVLGGAKQASRMEFVPRMKRHLRYG